MSKKILFLAVIIGMLAACSKDNDDAKIIATDESPIEALNTALGFDTNWQHTSHFGAQHGYTFQPLKDGTITAFTAKIGTIQTGNDVIISLYDKTDGEILMYSKAASLPLAKHVNTIPIDLDFPLEVFKTHEYVITKSSGYIYHHFNNDGSPGNYPVTVGSIRILNSVFGEGESFPDDNITTESYNGDVGFIFHPTE